jgi:DUF218 domain
VTVLTDHYRKALESSMPRCDPAAGVGVQIVIERSRPFGVVFGSAEVVGYWWGDSPVAELRLVVPSDAIGHIASGRATGSSLVMSGRVRLDGSWATMARFHRVAASQRFRAYTGHLADGISGRRDDVDPPDRSEPLDVYVVLAAPNDEHGILSPMAVDRLARAVEALRRDPGSRLVLTGGFGGQFNTTVRPHWWYSAAYLGSRGVRDADILARLETRHSYHDALFLRDLAENVPLRRITVVTSGYHADRIRFILDLVLPKTEIEPVRHTTIDPAELERLRQHEVTALGQTVAAALLFGPDRLLARLVRCRGDVWRSPTGTS